MTNSATDSTERTLHCPPFPPVIIEVDSGYWTGALVLGGAEVPMSLYIDASVRDASLADAAVLVSDLLSLSERGRAAIAEEAERDETIDRDFFQFHLEEVPDCLPEAVHDTPTKAAFIAALKLVGVAIHASEDAAFQLVLDYSYGQEHTDQLLAVTFHPDGTIHDVSHES